ncbi:MAG: hypothetical protein RBU30_25425 [Polyangia bacterium]|jgi:hypothetical protein|nr:hypothetical protein [Polyangia bacterium]
MTARQFALLALLGATLVVATPSEAKGRFERGRTLVQQRCASCFASGWIWAPSTPDQLKPHDLQTYARSWSPSKVCTWMRKQNRKTTGAACYPGHVSERDRLDMLFYLFRRAQGPIQRPRLGQASAFRPYKGKPLKRNLDQRRATVERQRKAQTEFARMRSLSRSRQGSPMLRPSPPISAPTPRSAR